MWTISTQKAMLAVVGFAFLWLAVTPVGKRVFLLVVAAIPNAMLCMTTTAGMVQKAAGGRKKSPPLAVKKQQFVSPPQPSPRGGNSFPLCLRMLLCAPSPWEGTEKLKPTIKLKVDDGEIAVLPFIICLF